MQEEVTVEFLILFMMHLHIRGSAVISSLVVFKGCQVRCAICVVD